MAHTKKHKADLPIKSDQLPGLTSSEQYRASHLGTIESELDKALEKLVRTAM